MELFTIAHSNQSIQAFIELWQKHDVTALADVRSHPYGIVGVAGVANFPGIFTEVFQVSNQLSNLLLTQNCQFVFSINCLTTIAFFRQAANPVKY